MGKEKGSVLLHSCMIPKNICCSCIARSLVHWAPAQAFSSVLSAHWRYNVPATVVLVFHRKKRKKERRSTMRLCKLSYVGRIGCKDCPWNMRIPESEKSGPRSTPFIDCGWMCRLMHWSGMNSSIIRLTTEPSQWNSNFSFVPKNQISKIMSDNTEAFIHA